MEILSGDLKDCFTGECERAQECDSERLRKINTSAYMEHHYRAYMHAHMYTHDEKLILALPFHDGHGTQREGKDIYLSPDRSTLPSPGCIWRKLVSPGTMKS